MSTSYLTPNEIMEVHNEWTGDCMLKMNHDKLLGNKSKEGKNDSIDLNELIRKNNYK